VCVDSKLHGGMFRPTNICLMLISWGWLHRKEAARRRPQWNDLLRMFGETRLISVHLEAGTCAYRPYHICLTLSLGAGCARYGGGLAQQKRGRPKAAQLDRLKARWDVCSHRARLLTHMPPVGCASTLATLPSQQGPADPLGQVTVVPGGTTTVVFFGGGGFS
jgi:hypothetical protein